jgi:phosphoribosyl-ATP pyrophosphohydrolase
VSYGLALVLRTVALASRRRAVARAARRVARRGLLDGGSLVCARKLGEEDVEAALAGAGESDERLVAELADLWFDSYILLAARGLDPAAVEEELRRRAAPRSG